MPCKYCGENDESKLLMSSRLVNGKVEHADLCLRCFWIDKFKAEDGILRERAKCGRKEKDSGYSLLEFQDVL